VLSYDRDIAAAPPADKPKLQAEKTALQASIATRVEEVKKGIIAILPECCERALAKWHHVDKAVTRVRTRELSTPTTIPPWSTLRRIWT